MIEKLRCNKCKKVTLHYIVDFGKEIKTKCQVCGQIDIIKKVLT